MTGCIKEIEIDYQTVDKKYVIESVTNEFGSYVYISRTSDMDDLMDQTPLEASSVSVTSSQGVTYPLTLQSEGHYLSTNAVAQWAGEILTLDIEIDGNHFSSYSEVIAPPTIKSAEIFTAEAMGKNVYTFCVTATKGSDIEGDSYYVYTIYTEDQKIVWGVYKHDGENESPITMSIFFATNFSGEIKATNAEETPISSGDVITLDLVAIDKRSYDYLNTLLLSSQSSSNPVDNFSGGALGYYSAYMTNRWSLVF